MKHTTLWLLVIITVALIGGMMFGYYFGQRQ